MSGQTDGSTPRNGNLCRKLDRSCHSAASPGRTVPFLVQNLQVGVRQIQRGDFHVRVNPELQKQILRAHRPHYGQGTSHHPAAETAFPVRRIHENRIAIDYHAVRGHSAYLLFKFRVRKRKVNSFLKSKESHHPGTVLHFYAIVIVPGCFTGNRFPDIVSVCEITFRHRGNSIDVIFVNLAVAQ